MTDEIEVDWSKSRPQGEGTENPRGQKAFNQLTNDIFEKRRKREGKKPLDTSTWSNPSSHLNEEDEEAQRVAARKAYAIMAAVQDLIAKGVPVAEAVKVGGGNFTAILSQIFSPSGGSENFTNLRTPGMPAGKHTAQAEGGRESHSGDYGKPARVVPGHPTKDDVSSEAQGFKNPIGIGEGIEIDTPSRGQGVWSRQHYDQQASTYTGGTQRPRQASTNYPLMHRNPPATGDYHTNLGRAREVSKTLFESWAMRTKVGGSLSNELSKGVRIDDSEVAPGKPGVELQDDEEERKKEFKLYEEEASRLEQAAAQPGITEMERKDLNRRASIFHKKATQAIRHTYSAPQY